MVDILEQVLLALLLIVLMTGMGATLTPNDFRELFRSPKGALIGLASQFGWMPLVAFGLAKGLALTPELAIALVVVGCTPGGTTSNLFAYYTKADVALSITMTAASTVVAVVMMPLLLSAYAASFTSADLQVPIGKIVVTLVLVLVPVLMGMAARKKWGQQVAARLEKAGSVSGIAVLLLLIASGLIRNRQMFATIDSNVYIATIALGVVGISLGWIGARVLGLDAAQRRAVAFETGIQNSPLAIAIVLTSFTPELAQNMVKVPLLYALFVLFNATVVTVVLRRGFARG